MALDLILSSFFRALGQIGDGRFRRVLWLGIALTIALLIVAYAALLWVVDFLAGPDAYFDGLIDEVRVYDRALSEGEALFLAGITSPVDKPF